jgi:ATP-binding protein involved in chromosome partitioning
MIENMSTHVCSHCGHKDAIFGEGGGERMAREFDIALLGALPLDTTIRQQTDNGAPTVMSHPDSENTKIYREIARQVAAKISLLPQSYAHKFPNIVVKN